MNDFTKKLIDVIEQGVEDMNLDDGTPMMAIDYCEQEFTVEVWATIDENGFHIHDPALIRKFGGKKHDDL